MERRTRYLVVVAVAVALVGGGAGVALATGGETETPISGDALVRASAAALAETGGGRVTGSEVGDEDGYYEVEVTLDDGSQVDVALDVDFRVLGTQADRDRPGDEGR
jgi:hypothetical protein